MDRPEELEESHRDVKAYVEHLEAFVTECRVGHINSNKIEELYLFVERGSKKHKLWQELRLKKYPGEY